MKPLDPRQFQTLPLHDARAISLEMKLATSSRMHVRLELEINIEESMAEFNALGISSRCIAFIFPECWKMTSNLIKEVDEIGTLDDWEVKRSPPLLEASPPFKIGTSLYLLGHIAVTANSSMWTTVLDQFLIGTNSAQGSNMTNKGNH